MAGLRKQQDLADRRRSQIKVNSKSPSSNGTSEEVKIKSSPSDVKATLRPTPKSQEVDKDWLVANLDVLLPPLSQDDLDELEDEDELMEVSSSTPHIERSSPRLPSPRSFATFGTVEQDQPDDRLFLDYSPPSSPLGASHSTAFGGSIINNADSLSYAQKEISVGKSLPSLFSPADKQIHVAKQRILPRPLVHRTIRWLQARYRPVRHQHRTPQSQQTPTTIPTSLTAQKPTGRLYLPSGPSAKSLSRARLHFRRSLRFHLESLVKHPGSWHLVPIAARSSLFL